MQVRREPMPPTAFRTPYRWCQIDPADICLPVTDGIEDHAKLYQMHCGITLTSPPPPATVTVASVSAAGASTTAGSVEMSHEDKLNHQKWLKAKASRSSEREEILCRLCNVMLNSPSELLIHLSSLKHRKNQPV